MPINLNLATSSLISLIFSYFPQLSLHTISDLINHASNLCCCIFLFSSTYACSLKSYSRNLANLISDVTTTSSSVLLLALCVFLITKYLPIIHLDRLPFHDKKILVLCIYIFLVLLFCIPSICVSKFYPSNTITLHRLFTSLPCVLFSCYCRFDLTVCFQLFMAYIYVSSIF